MWSQQATTPSNQNKLGGGISMSMGGNVPTNKNWGNNNNMNRPPPQQQQQLQQQQQSWQQRASNQMYGQKQQQQRRHHQQQQQQKYMQPPQNQQKQAQPSPNQRRQKNIQSAGKSIVYQDYRDSNAVSQKHNGPKSGLKFGKPSGTPQGAVVISPAQLRAKSMKNSKHLKGRRKKSSPPIQGTRF